MSILGISELQWIIGTVTTIFLVCWYYSQKLKYWEQRGIKGPKPVLFFGNFLDFLYRPSPEIEIERYKKFGKIYGYVNF